MTTPYRFRLRVYASAFITKERRVQASIWIHLYERMPEGGERCVHAYHSGDYVTTSMDHDDGPTTADLTPAAVGAVRILHIVLITMQAADVDVVDPIAVRAHHERVAYLRQSLTASIDCVRATGEYADLRAG